MYKQYGEEVQFYFVYCREAHAIDSDRPAGKEVEQPVSTDERRSVAADFLKEMELEIPSLLDNIDDKTSKDYASHPDRMYLVGSDGRIAYAGDKGPRGFKPDELEAAIKDELSKSKADSSSDRPLDRPTRRLMMLPLFRAINVDGDSGISKEEIESAPASLLKLDKNNDGELSEDELKIRRRR